MMIFSKNNTPTLMESEEKRAPWNEKTKKIEVTISQTLSCTTEIEVPIDFDEFNNEGLKEEVQNQVFLPSQKYLDWYVDDFCVAI